MYWSLFLPQNLKTLIYLLFIFLLLHQSKGKISESKITIRLQLIYLAIQKNVYHQRPPQSKKTNNKNTFLDWLKLLKKISSWYKLLINHLFKNVEFINTGYHGSISLTTRISYSILLINQIKKREKEEKVNDNQHKWMCCHSEGCLSTQNQYLHEEWPLTNIDKTTPTQPSFYLEKV